MLPGFDVILKTIFLPLLWQPFIFTHKACLECEQPNGDLHKFRGRFSIAHEENQDGARSTAVPVSMSEMLLRGTLLKNSKLVALDCIVLTLSNYLCTQQVKFLANCSWEMVFVKFPDG